MMNTFDQMRFYVMAVEAEKAVVRREVERVCQLGSALGGRRPHPLRAFMVRLCRPRAVADDGFHSNASIASPLSVLTQGSD